MKYWKSGMVWRLLSRRTNYPEWYALIHKLPSLVGNNVHKKSFQRVNLKNIDSIKTEWNNSLNKRHAPRFLAPMFSTVDGGGAGGARAPPEFGGGGGGQILLQSPLKEKVLLLILPNGCPGFGFQGWGRRRVACSPGSDGPKRLWRPLWLREVHYSPQ